MELFVWNHLRPLLFICIILNCFLYFCIKNSKISGVEIFTLPTINSKISNSTGRWIVVTSIQYPTEDVKRLASQGWNLVVVADRKTPADWNYTGVHFLSIEKQQTMYRLATVLPMNSYTRKNIGYLFAIQHGAKWIYDTDDDNKPYGKGLGQFDYSDTISGLRYSSEEQILFNPYRFSGFIDMWPRGFPLESIKNHLNGETLILCREMKTSAVQQGIVSHDPDVDAIFRLLEADKKHGLDASFNPHTPPITLEAGTYSPWNSQNTLFKYEAFFTLFLPTTVAFRVTDIWRSYFSQKLLHLIGENVAFYPVNAIQYRNAHNYLEDFKQEIDVYTKSGEMVAFLSSWSCSSERIQNCTVELAKAFVEKGFWKQDDKTLIEIWLEELDLLGYSFPPLQTKEVKFKPTGKFMENCRFANLDLGSKSYDGQSQSLARKKLSNFEDILSWCDEADSHLNNSLPSPQALAISHQNRPSLAEKSQSALIIINNFPWRGSIGLLQRLYSPYFAVTLLCGTWEGSLFLNETLRRINPVNYIHVSKEEMNSGHHYYYCISKARDMQLQNVKGYFFMGDDAVFNFWHSLPNEIINPHESTSYFKNWWNPKNLKKAAALLEGKYKNNEKIQKVWEEYQHLLDENKTEISASDHVDSFTGKTPSDFFYLPQERIDFFAEMSEIFGEARVFVENVMSKLFNVTNSFYKEKRFLYLWNEEREKRYELYNSSLLGLHAIKTSNLESDLDERKRYCQSVVRAFKEELYDV